MNPSRRDFLAATSLSTLSAGMPLASGNDRSPQVAGSAEHCIMIWLGGGASQIDTFDPKRVSSDGLKDPGSAYAAIETAISGVRLCEHLRRTAPLLDRCAPIRGVYHDVVDEHAAAAYRMHTGRPTSGTTVYPSLGSIVSHLKGTASDAVPPYVLMGNPSPSREPGFLGPQHASVYLTETRSGPQGLAVPARVGPTRQARRTNLLAGLRKKFAEANVDDRTIQEYVAAAKLGQQWAGPEFLSVFDLAMEPGKLRSAYGDEFGQRCLLARRLIERGTRFVEVSFNLNFKNGTGWDTHKEGHKRQHLLIQSLDEAFATLLEDLEQRKLLDKTVLLIATEFGRPASFDAQGGRGHHAKSFSVLLGGGGMRTGQAIGETDELGMTITSDPTSVPDLFATILAAMNVDWTAELYDGARPVPVTDGGQPIGRLFARS